MLAVGDVDHHALPQQRLAIGVVDQDRLVAEPHDLSILGDHPIVLPVGPLSGGDHPVALGIDQRQIVGVGGLPPEPGTSPLLLCVPEQPLDVRAHERFDLVAVVDAAVQILLIRHRRGLFHDRAEPLVGNPELVLGGAAVGDVGHEPEEVVDAAIVAVDRLRAVVDPPVGPVGSTHPVFLVERLGVFGAERSRRLQPRPVVRVHQAEPEAGILQEALGREAQDLLDLRAHESHPHDVVRVQFVGVGDGGDQLHDVAPSVFSPPALFVDPLTRDRRAQQRGGGAQCLLLGGSPDPGLHRNRRTRSRPTTNPR